MDQHQRGGPLVARSYECLSVLKDRGAAVREREQAFEEILNLPGGWWNAELSLIVWVMGVALHTARRLTIHGEVGKDQLDWEDAATRALLAFYDSAARIETNPAGWLRGTVRNMLRDEIDVLRRTVALDSMRDDPADPAGSTEANEEPVTTKEADRLRRYDDLLKAIMALPAAQRVVAQLHFLEGHSAVEIAQLLALKPSTVRQRVHRVREALRKTFEADSRGD